MDIAIGGENRRNEIPDDFCHSKGKYLISQRSAACLPFLSCGNVSAPRFAKAKTA